MFFTLLHDMQIKVFPADKKYLCYKTHKWTYKNKSNLDSETLHEVFWLVA